MAVALASAGGLAGLLRYFTYHKTAANLILVVIIILGIAAFPRLRAQFFPDFVFETVHISAEWDGAGAEDIDEAIVQLVLPELSNVDGVVESSSVASEGRARVSLEFAGGWEMDQAVNDVKAAIDRITGLPEGVEDPEVRRAAWTDRVTDVVVTGPVSVEQLGRLADEFVVKLFESGVSRTTVRGIRAPLTVVEVEESELLRNEIEISEIARLIGEEAKTDPSGEVGGGARVRAGIAKRTPDQIEGISIRSNPDGSKLFVGDFARVFVEGMDRERAYFVDQNPAVSIRVDRSGTGDAIALQQAVEDTAASLMTTAPAGVSFDLIRTRSEAITGRLNVLYTNGLLGLALVIGLLFLFLNSRVAFWVAAGIPTAMCAAIVLMYVFGQTLNMISLFGLIITLGIVVDDAIVVGEHADFRARRLRESPGDAAANAAVRMAPPVFAATVTTLIAFLGLLAIGGRFETIILALVFTVVVVLAASLIECFIILPNHMRHALSHVGRNHWYDIPSRLVNAGFNWFRDRIFHPAMGWVVVLRYPIAACAFLFLATQLILIIGGDVRWRFFNAPELGSVSGNFAMAPGAGREDSAAMMRELQRAAAAVGKKYEEEYGTDPVTYVLAEIGGSTGRGLSGADTKDIDQLGSIAIELIDADLRPYSSFEFVGALQDEVRRHPLLETLSFRGGRFGPGGDALDVEISGANSRVLKAAAEELKSAVAQLPEVSAVEDDLAYDKEELVLELTPQGRALGFTIDGIGRVLRDRLGGARAATFPVGTRTGEILVRLPEAELTADFLERWRLKSSSGHYVPLTDVVTVERHDGFSTVRRANGIRVVSVTGDISEDNPERAAEITAQIRDQIMPEISESFGVTWNLSGMAEQERDFLGDAAVGAVLVLAGIFLTLVWVFSSWSKPIVVLLTIPFGLVGVIHGHNLWDVPLSMYSVIGIIGMAGIIINDSIILITTQTEYARDRGVHPAIIDATTDRLRPVLLTTLTTVVGLIPLLYETSRQASFLKPTVITLTYGLGFGMLLVLLLVPSLLAILNDIHRLVQSTRRAVRASGNGRIVKIAVVVTTALALAWFAGTVGQAVLLGTLPLMGLWPIPQDSPQIVWMVSLSLYLGGLGVICLFGFLLTAQLARLRKKASLRPADAADRTGPTNPPDSYDAGGASRIPP